MVQRAGLLRRCDQSREIGSRESEGQAIPSVADPPFSAEFGTLVVIHDPELRDVAVVTVAAEQRASAGRAFVPILMDACCLEFGRSISSTPR